MNRKKKQSQCYDNLEDMLLSDPKLLFKKKKRLRQLQDMQKQQKQQLKFAGLIKEEKIDEIFGGT